MSRNAWLTVIGAATWLAALAISPVIYAPAGDPYAMFRYVMRVIVAVPLAICLVIVGVRIFDHHTEEDWFTGIQEDVQAKALILAALILGMVWLAVQS